MTKISKFTSGVFLCSIILSSCTNGDSSKATTEEATKPKFDLTVAKKEIEATNQNIIDLFAKHDSVGILDTSTFVYHNFTKKGNGVYYFVPPSANTFIRFSIVVCEKRISNGRP